MLTFLAFMSRTMVAWYTNFLSSSTAARTSVASAFCSDLTGWLRLTLSFLDLKSEEVSVSAPWLTVKRPTQVEVIRVSVLQQYLCLDQQTKLRLQYRVLKLRAR